MPLVIDDEGTAKALRIVARYVQLLYANGKTSCNETIDYQHTLQNIENWTELHPPSTLKAP